MKSIFKYYLEPSRMDMAPCNTDPLSTLQPSLCLLHNTKREQVELHWLLKAWLRII